MDISGKQTSKKNCFLSELSKYHRLLGGISIMDSQNNESTNTNENEQNPTEFEEEAKQTHYEYEEVNVNRIKTTSYITKEKAQITILQVLAYLKTQKAADNVTCLNKVVKDDMQIFEISYATNEDKAKYDGILNGKILVNNIVLTQIDNRPFKDIVKVPLISVAIFEAPHELKDIHIINKLRQYGTIKDNTVYRHKIRGTEIKNGIRSVNFRNINMSIPTVLFVQGNKVKIKYTGQDRTPICSFCKSKGRWKNICEERIKQMEEREKIVKQSK